MNLQINPGKYIVAVSGGVDSMVLLDMLARAPGMELIVAHYEHGIRTDSDDDRKLVQAAAAKHGLPFVYERGNLGPGASEAAAREARYAFLRRVRAEHAAHAIVTAHHQDDVIETAIINMVRGTGPKGLSALRSTDGMVRPLLDVPKTDLERYAQDRRLQWHEDSTNSDERYLRNYVRRRLMSRMSPEQRLALLRHIDQAASQNDEIGRLITNVRAGRVTAGHIGRGWFIQLPYDVSRTVLAETLREAGAQFDRPGIHRLVVFMKTGALGKRADVDKTHYLEVGKNHIIVGSRP
ncbi:MAG TPA: tRNA lysidine(34) synthetase TilS [Bacillota bacterium]|nr:tRNA lysidine(34) synthetase TilS [Bacillota bacterium]